ncbi:hypothetical protein ABFS82_02G030900 [Erythranthe guttata]|uniref:Sodium channel modifier 1 n=1 Tax=Erythranthe guttata TaxID=4155 RepID=A0A022RCD0_ERYGU|nr:PREDICTED: sodium channel modifier 1-like [Erythranthe guttata]EYU37709.1 hypothetical protein MIMGU_mgv11b011564mg [Erythranthe guttata]EYU37710.1 hypothetical protein MIMGU_mgv11b011564mg [Erythranthe guttata]|eukprot:XP_012836973.1 PREDICTED: sodium channel modifier 1-like [Erythranthe guttata]
MSVFGGDSWGREAQHRKRRVDDLLIENVEASLYKKLPSGKFACLVCPNNPVLDTATTLSTHVNGARHRSAELKHRERKLAREEEVNRRLAFSDSVSINSASSASIKPRKTSNKPLIERTRKATSEVFSGEFIRKEVKSETVNPIKIEEKHDTVVVEVQPLDYRERNERELKFTEAGWKRDGHGRWFKDENVEFDSDEEDPNIVLNDSV